MSLQKNIYSHRPLLEDHFDIICKLNISFLIIAFETKPFRLVGRSNVSVQREILCTFQGISCIFL